MNEKRYSENHKKQLEWLNRELRTIENRKRLLVKQSK